jgi:hypothetical protein
VLTPLPTLTPTLVSQAQGIQQQAPVAQVSGVSNLPSTGQANAERRTSGTLLLAGVLMMFAGWGVFFMGIRVSRRA